MQCDFLGLEIPAEVLLPRSEQLQRVVHHTAQFTFQHGPRLEALVLGRQRELGSRKVGCSQTQVHPLPLLYHPHTCISNILSNGIVDMGHTCGYAPNIILDESQVYSFSFLALCHFIFGI